MNPFSPDAMSQPRSSTRRVRRGVALAVSVISSIGLAACGGSDDTPAADPATVAADVSASDGRPAFGLVSTADAADLAVDPEVVVIDVRTPEEFAEGHIEGATLIDINSPTFGDEIDALDRDANYLVYCRSDNRSGQAVEIMQQIGFEQVWDMDGGIVVWSAEGRPVVR